MSLVNLCVNQFEVSSIIDYIEAELLYPKLVIIENNNTLHLCDINNINESQCKREIKKHTYQFNEEIIGKYNHSSLFWLLLKSREIVVINVEDESKIHLNVDNYKIREFGSDGETLFFISESGEHLANPFTEDEIKLKIGEGVNVMNTFLTKTLHRRSAIKPTESIWNGIFIEKEDKNIILKCPLTGAIDILSFNNSFQHVLPWDDKVVIVDKSNMSLINLQNSHIYFTFPDMGSNYYPVKVHNATLYYVQWLEKKVYVCCAWSAASVTNNLEHDDSSVATAILSSQETLKQQLNYLVDIAILEAKPEQVMSQLKSYFEKIEDYVFLINIANKLCKHSFIYKSILFLLQNKIYVTGDGDLIYKITDLINKIDLLEYICFRGNKNYDDINIYEKDFVNLCITFISKSDLDLASICWLKYNDIRLTINSDDVNNILSAMPYNIKMSSLIIWLKNYVPALLDENPFFIDYFVKWTMERVFQLEQSSYWPKIGLKFIEEIIIVLENSLKTVTIRPISMDELDTLKDRIDYIIELKDRYRINMLLGELCSQAPSEVALIMLRRCYTEDLEIFLQDYMPSYAARHVFELDDILRMYIENEAAVSGGGVDGFRLKIILNAFRSSTYKLECLLEVLKVLDVPWDANILDIVVHAAASPCKDFTVTDVDRTLALEIQEELNYAKVKVILKKYNFPLTCTDYMLVLNKLMSVASVNLQDLNVITTVMTNYKNYANILYIDRCLRDCETKTAINYFKNLTNKQKNILSKSAINKYEQIVHSNTSDITIEKNYLDFLKGTMFLTEHQIRDLENLYHLKNSYNVIVTMNNFYDEQFCHEKLNAWMCENGGTVSSAKGECISKLLRTYQSDSLALASLLRKTSSRDSVRKFIESLIKMHNGKIYANTLPLSVFRDAGNTELLVNSFNTLVDLVSKCEEDYLHDYTSYLALLNALMNANIMLKHLSVTWKFQYIYLPMSSITGMNDLIRFFEKTLMKEYTEDSIYDILEGYDFIPIRMISTLLTKSFVTANNVSDDFYIIRDKIVKKLLTKVVACKELDEILLTCLLIALSKDDDQNTKLDLLDTLRGTSDTLPPNILNYMSAQLIRRTFILDVNLAGNRVPYSPQHILKSKFNINLADIALPENSEETWDVKVILFCVLKQYPDTSFERLIELCRTLNVSLNDGLTLQLTSLLSTWDLKYKLFYDNLNCRQITFENDENSLMSKCIVVWENIKHKELILDILTDLWKNGEVSLHGRSVSVNPYYYEVYLCIYHLIFSTTSEARSVKEYFLLNFLKDYRRKSNPKQYEFELFSVKGMFPEVGYYRLPFHLFMRDDMWSNLKSEITLETYERWLPVVSLLSLDADMQTARDMICSNALKQTMTSRKGLEGADVEGNEPWRLITKEEPLLRAAHKCVRYIANMEWAGACLFYVLQGCARGADQVAAAQLCYQFAQRWAAVQPGNRAVRQMERLHSSLSTRHALHKINWAHEEFVRLSTEPAQLIRALYLHPSFVDKMCRHDVNRAVNEIADKNGINISSIRIQILENILEKHQDENKNDKKVSGLNSKELKTAKYILKATCPKMGAIYLSRIAFDDESDFNKCKKLRALQCLMSIIETDTAVKVANREREALWNSLLELIHVVNLENIDMPWVVATFMQDKLKAIEQLLQSGANIEGLKIAAELCRKYGNVKIIRELIPLLLRAGLYEEMTPLLLKTSSLPNELMYTGWRAVIVSPFQRADYPITERQKLKCLNAINLLPVCPIIKDEDLLEIWKNCVRCKCFGIGCLVLPYMTSETRQTLNDLKKIDKRYLISSLKNLHAETYLISGAMHVIENMLPRSLK